STGNPPRDSSRTRSRAGRRSDKVAVTGRPDGPPGRRHIPPAPSGLLQAPTLPRGHRVLDAAQLVHHVQDTQPRMAPDHPWTRMAHDRPGLLALNPLVAMDRAARTGRLAVPERTVL